MFMRRKDRVGRFWFVLREIRIDSEERYCRVREWKGRMVFLTKLLDCRMVTVAVLGSFLRYCSPDFGKKDFD